MAHSRRAPGVRDLPWSTAGRRSSLVSLQLAFPPLCVFEIGIEDPLMIAVDRLQHSHLSENHRAVVLCRPRASGRGLLTAWPRWQRGARRINVF